MALLPDNCSGDDASAAAVLVVPQIVSDLKTDVSDKGEAITYAFDAANVRPRTK